MGKGTVWPSERSTYTDPQSGIPVTKLTAYNGHSHHLYFTEDCWLIGENEILIHSDRQNKTDLFRVHIDSGEMVQLTDLEPGVGLRPCLSPCKTSVYFSTGRRIVALDLETLAETVIYEESIDSNYRLGMVHCTADGKYVVTALTERRNESTAGTKRNSKQDRHPLQANWESAPLTRIVRISIADGALEDVHEEHSWISHINASPTQAELITFCHEGPWHMVDQRIWGLNLDSGHYWQIRPREEQREKVGHEYWLPDGVTIGYHGFRENGIAFFGKIKYDNTEKVEVEFPFKTWHVHSHHFDKVVADGRGVDTLTIWEKDGDQFGPGRILAEHRCSFKVQKVHVHPRFSPIGKKLVFTSDHAGYANVYVVDIPDNITALPVAPYAK